MVQITGGDKMEAALRSIAGKLSRPATLRVGFLEGGTYPDKEHTSIPMVAAMNEFGHDVVRYGEPDASGKRQRNVIGHSPPRPFFRRMVSLGASHWAEDLGELLVATDYDEERSLRLLGEQMRGELVQSITDQVYAPLAESTIRRKGHDITLLETSVMKNSVEAEVTT